MKKLFSFLKTNEQLLDIRVYWRYRYAIVTIYNKDFDITQKKAYVLLKNKNIGPYIGTSKWAYRLYKRGIKPELISKKHNICSIGFNEKEQKWYGWSHRAIYGFCIGSKVEKGDCAYIPKTKKDQIENEVKWKSDIMEAKNIKVIKRKTGFTIYGTFKSGKQDKSFYRYKLGKGEWIAKSLTDAKQMAIDFANSVN